MKVITIGRDASNDIVIEDDPHASRHHLQIIQHDDGRFTLKDFGSTNGTSVNGKRINGEISLSETDVVRIGSGHPIPWIEYFYTDNEGHYSASSNDNKAFSSSTTITEAEEDNKNEKEEDHLNNRLLKAFCILSLTTGILFLMYYSLWCLLTPSLISVDTGILISNVYEPILLLSVLVEVVLSIVILRKSSTNKISQ